MRSTQFGSHARRLLAAALLLGVLPLATPVQSALAAPAAPGDLAPDSTSIGGQPALSWSRVKGAAEYDVQISASPDFSPTLYDETTENSQATPTSNLPSGSLFWRVRGVSASHVRGSWATASFDHSAMAGPDLLTPAAGAELQQPQDSPLLTWNPVNAAVSYTIEIDTDEQFIDATTGTVKGTGTTFESPSPNQTYYWHVKANLNGSFTSDWSETRDFKVLALPAPELISPDDSSTTQVQDAALDWAPVPGAVEYEVRVSTDDQFNTLIDSATVESTRYARPVTYDNDQYWWEVRAIDVNGNASPWSTSLNQFQRNWPNKPKLVYPFDGSIVSTPLYYQWDGVPHASSYRLEVSGDPSFSPGNFDTCLTTNTTYTAGRTTGACGAGGAVTYWRVRPLDAPRSPAVNGVYSDIHSFTYAPGGVQQTSPDPGSPGILVDVPTLTWNQFPQAEKYRVEVTEANGHVAAAATTYATSWTPSGNVRLNPLDGPFHWTVEALLKDGSSTSVPLFGDDPTFQVRAQDDVPDDLGVAALTPTSPANPTSNRFPALSWEPWFNPGPTPAAYYRVFVGTAGSGAFAQLGSNFPYSAATDVSSDYLAAGSYEWFARAYDLNGTLLGTGTHAFFTISDLPYPSNNRLSLTGQGLESPDTTCARSLPETPTTTDVCTSLQNTPVLKWNPVPNAAYYMIYLARDRELTNMVYSPTTQLTVNTMWTPTDMLPDSQAGTAYYWAIRPCKTSGVCSPDPTIATNAFDKRSNPVTGLTEYEHDSPSPLPGHGPGGLADPPKFADEIVLTWDDYLLTNQAGNDKDVTDMPSQVEARAYKVQISSSPTFSSDFVYTSQLLDQTSFTPYSTTLPEGPLYWRVQAIDGSGNALAWSLSRSTGDATQGIEKVSPVPSLNAPADSETVSGTPAFSWDALAYAAKYDVQVARHGDTTFSTANLAATGSKLKRTTYVPTNPLPASGNPYVWRVRRIDADNRAGAWSAPQTFSVTAEAPSQIGPNDGAYVSSRDALFTWLPVDGAVSYRYERRTQGGTSVQETKTTTGLAWAPQKRIADGNYEWRVSSIDTMNNVIGSSPWRPFKVDGTAPTVVRKSPTSTAVPTSVVKVDFSERVKGVTTSTFKLFVKGSSEQLPATVKLTNKKKTATLKPSARLKPGKTYTVKLLSTITDQAGIALKPVTWSITVKK